MFTRSGGEAAAVAVRLSRAASGKSGIAICGYHGWHDWYLSANLQSEESLDNHLLRGLSTDGVPIELLGTAKTFAYNDLGALKEILREGKTGTIIMEVERNFAPSEGFLEGVRLLADEYGAVLIFDECTSGFREVMGGLHLKYGVEPDMLILGKTLGNGYAINSVLGRRNVMETRLNSFISSTFWTERIGPSAALAALKEMQDVEAPRRIDRIGRKVRESWAQLAGKKGLPIVISGLPALSTFTIEGFNHLEVKTFVVESLLSRGFLGATAFYASIAHGDQVIDSYLSAVDEVFGEIARLGPEGLGSALPNGIAASGFSRLN
jgi:glutamate-1-semialdehyde aminotransferase